MRYVDLIRRLLVIAVLLSVFYDLVVSKTHAEDQDAGDAAGINAVFGSGLEIYRFGMTPQEVNNQLPEHFSTLTWSSMPIAHEYKTDEIRYFWIHVSNYLQMKYASVFAKEIGIYPIFSLPSCISKASYIVFLFKHEWLFHISLRALAQKDCDDYNYLFYGISKYFKLAIAQSGDQVTFTFNGSSVHLIGTKNPRGAILDIIKPGIAGRDGDQAVP